MGSSTILSDIKIEVTKMIAELSDRVSEEIDRRGGLEEKEEMRCNFTGVKMAMLDFMLESYDSEKIDSEEKFDVVVTHTMAKIQLALKILMS